MLEVRELTKDRRNINRFIQFAWTIYKQDPNFVMPLVADMRKSLLGIHNALFDNGEQAFLMAYEDGHPVARLLVGTNEQLNAARGYKQGYLSLFECVNDQKAANAILDHACDWLRARGMNRIVGPENYTYDDFGKGLQIEGFEGPPVLFGVYNPEYYITLFESFGFVKQYDHLAYYLDDTMFDVDKYGPAVEYAMKKYGFSVERVDLDHHFEREVKDIAYVLSTAMPDLLDQLAPPTEDDVRAEAKMLKDMADQELIFIARAGERPVGFLLGMPDYNQIIQKMKGRMLSPALLSFLKERRRAHGKKVGGKLIDGLRVLILFVIPEFQNKAVTGAMMMRFYKTAKRKGYRWAELSTVDERNIYSRNTVEKSGARIYRKYRTYEKTL